MTDSSVQVRDFSGELLTKDDINFRLQTLLHQILDDPKLNEFRTDAGFLLRFLHCSNFNIQLAIIKIHDYHNAFLEHPRWFCSKSPSEIKDRLEFKDKILLKEKDKEGRRIFIVKLGNMRTDCSSLLEESKMFEVWLEYLAQDFETQCKGLCVILDVKGYSWKLLRWFTPANIKTTLRRILTYPLKDYQIHIVNNAALVKAAIKIVWPFLNEEFRNKFKFHFEDWEAFHQYIDPINLPPEYRGTGCHLNYDKCIQQLLEKSDEIGERLSKQKVLNM